MLRNCSWTCNRCIQPTVQIKQFPTPLVFRSPVLLPLSPPDSMIIVLIIVIIVILVIIVIIVILVIILIILIIVIILRI